MPKLHHVISSSLSIFYCTHSAESTKVLLNTRRTFLPDQTENCQEAGVMLDSVLQVNFIKI